jgi:hypothetical protein
MCFLKVISQQILVGSGSPMLANFKGHTLVTFDSHNLELCAGDIMRTLPDIAGCGKRFPTVSMIWRV